MKRKTPKAHHRPAPGRTVHRDTTPANIGERIAQHADTPSVITLAGEEARAYLDWKRASQLLVEKAQAIKPLIAERQAAYEEMRLAAMGEPFEKAKERFLAARAAADGPEVDMQETILLVREALQRMCNAAAPGSGGVTVPRPPG